MNTRQLRQKLNSGQTVFGVFTPYSDPTFAELLGQSGFDFIVYDAEHGVIDETDMPALAMAAENRNSVAIVRPPRLENRTIGRYLDFGAQAIMMPMVNSRADGEALIQACHYPPQGVRGVAMTRSLDFGIADDLPQKLDDSNTSLLTLAQIETREALANLDEILMVEHLDLIFVGPADLSASLGVPFQFHHPELIGALTTIASQTKQANKHLGILVNDPGQVTVLRQLGFRFFAIYIDMLIASAGREFLSTCRQDTASPQSAAN